MKSCLILTGIETIVYLSCDERLCPKPPGRTQPAATAHEKTPRPFPPLSCTLFPGRGTFYEALVQPEREKQDLLPGLMQT